MGDAKVAERNKGIIEIIINISGAEGEREEKGDGVDLVHFIISLIPLLEFFVPSRPTSLPICLVYLLCFCLILISEQDSYLLCPIYLSQYLLLLPLRWTTLSVFFCLLVFLFSLYKFLGYAHDFMTSLARR